MRVQQLRQKLMFLPIFLAVCSFLLYLGYFAPLDWESEKERRFDRLVGPFLTVTTLLWFFFGSIEWRWPFERLNRNIEQELSEKPVGPAEEGDR